jgi:hypothetical protein
VQLRDKTSSIYFQDFLIKRRLKFCILAEFLQPNWTAGKEKINRDTWRYSKFKKTNRDYSHQQFCHKDTTLGSYSQNLS